MVKKWRLLTSKVAYENPFLTVYNESLQRSDGKVIADYYAVKRRDAAFVAALTKDNQVLLVNQYKNGVKEVVWELPAGFIEEGEEPLAAAKRELLEETGYESDNFDFIGKFAPNPAISPNRNFVFLAKDATKVAEQKLDVNEEIEVQTFDLGSLVQDIKTGKSLFIDCQSQLSLLLIVEILKK